MLRVCHLEDSRKKKLKPICIKNMPAIAGTGTKLTLENGVPGEKLLVTKPVGAIINKDQIVNLVMIVKDVEVKDKGKQSGAIIYRGEREPDERSYIIWDVDRFIKFPLTI